MRALLPKLKVITTLLLLLLLSSAPVTANNNGKLQDDRSASHIKTQLQAGLSYVDMSAYQVDNPVGLSFNFQINLYKHLHIGPQVTYNANNLFKKLFENETTRFFIYDILSTLHLNNDKNMQDIYIGASIGIVPEFVNQSAFYKSIFVGAETASFNNIKFFGEIKVGDYTGSLNATSTGVTVGLKLINPE